jgi:hypothetical protein
MRRLLLLGLVAGCATTTTLAAVSDSEWKRVPASERDTIERAHAKELAAADAEQRAAAAALSAAKQAARAQAPKPAAVADATRSRSIADIDLAKQEWLRATVTWRERRLEAAAAHVTTVWSLRELDRAHAVDRHLPSDDNYNVVEFRGQFATAQELWFRATDRATEARHELERATQKLAYTKETYAMLVRGDAPTSDDVGRLANARFTLPAWTTGDVNRRGIRYVAATCRLERRPRDASCLAIASAR